MSSREAIPAGTHRLDRTHSQYAASRENSPSPVHTASSAASCEGTKTHRSRTRLRDWNNSCRDLSECPTVLLSGNTRRKPPVNELWFAGGTAKNEAAEMKKPPRKQRISRRFQAERQGFEPWIPLRGCRFSRPVQSAALPPLQVICAAPVTTDCGNCWQVLAGLAAGQPSKSASPAAESRQRV
jgi:hypothetical protein